MGTFGGHALPGSFFLFFAVYMIYHQLKSYFTQFGYGRKALLTGHKRRYRTALSYPIKLPFNSPSCFCRQTDELIPVDSYLKAVLCIIGIIGEVITGFDEHWVFVHIGNLQHVSMYSLFGLSGLVEICVFYNRLKLPFYVEHLFNILALSGELTLFAFHLHGRSMLDVHIHLLLATVIVLGIVFGILEMINPNRIIFGLLRSWTLLMQGTWFWHVGTILYPPFEWTPLWNKTAVQDVTHSTNLFNYHMLGNFVFICLALIVINLRSNITNRNEKYPSSTLLTDATTTTTTATPTPPTTTSTATTTNNNDNGDANLINQSEVEEFELWDMGQNLLN